MSSVKSCCNANLYATNSSSWTSYLAPVLLSLSYRPVWGPVPVNHEVTGAPQFASVKHAIALLATDWSSYLSPRVNLVTSDKSKYASPNNEFVFVLTFESWRTPEISTGVL